MACPVEGRSCSGGALGILGVRSTLKSQGCSSFDTVLETLLFPALKEAKALRPVFTQHTKPAVTASVALDVLEPGQDSGWDGEGQSKAIQAIT